MRKAQIKRGKEAEIAQWAHRLFSHAVGARCSAGIDFRIENSERLIEGDSLKKRYFYEGEDMGPYMNIIEQKYQDALDAITDLQFSVRQKGWTLKPTAKPTVPERVIRATAERMEKLVTPVYLQYLQANRIDPGSPEARRALGQISDQFADEALRIVDQGAKRASERLEQEIQDQLQEDWPKWRDKMYAHMCKYPYAVGKIPYFAWHSSNQWKEDTLQFGSRKRMTASVLDPRMFYLSPDSTDAQDGKYVLETIPIGMGELAKMMREPEMYNVKAIKEIFSKYKQVEDFVWWTNVLETKQNLKPFALSKSLITNLQSTHNTLGVLVYGTWTGIELQKAGFKSVNDYEEYQLELMVVGDYVLMANLNTYPDKRRPYHIAAFRDGTTWQKHRGIPDLLESIQRAAQAEFEDILEASNAAARPVMEVDVALFETLEVPEDIQPGDTIFTENSVAERNRDAVKYHLKPTNLPGIQSVYMMFLQQASDVCGIASQLVGASSQSSVNRTGSVYAGAVAGSLKKVRAITLNLDKAIGDAIRMCSNLIMVYSDKFDIKWDVDVITTGSEGVIEREQLRQDLGFVLQTVTNAALQGIVPVELYHVVLHQVLAEYGLNYEDVFPNPRQQAELGNILSGLPGENPIQPSNTQAPLTPGLQLDGRSTPAPTGQIQTPTDLGNR